MNADIFPAMGSSLVSQIPVISALVVGIVLALQRRKRRHPHASTALAAFLLLMASVLVFTPLTVLLPRFVQDRGGDAFILGIAYTMVTLLQSLVTAIGVGLLIRAVFVGKAGRPKRVVERA